MDGQDRAPAALAERGATGAAPSVEALAAEVSRLRAALAEAERQAAALAELCEADELTGLLNRRGLLRALAGGLAYQQRHGGNAVMIFVDLDGFKGVNDRHGHAAGDAVLRRVAELVRDSTRASDIVGRLGGDEFVLVLWRCSRDAGEKKAKALTEAIAEAMGEIMPGTRVGASAGIVSLAASEAPEAALARADAAMYADKRARREAPEAPR